MEHNDGSPTQEAISDLFVKKGKKALRPRGRDLKAFEI